MKENIIHLIYKILFLAKNFVLTIFGLKTVGVRALVVNNHQVFLIKHTYQKGWHTIGGGVKNNESMREAILRELLEEVGLVPLEEPYLFSVYHNKFKRRDDYIALYIIKKFEMKDVYSLEIAEKKWFPFNALPLDITPGTRRRIDEFLGKNPLADKW